jgi:hypothetical protein
MTVNAPKCKTCGEPHWGTCLDYRRSKHERKGEDSAEVVEPKKPKTAKAKREKTKPVLPSLMTGTELLVKQEPVLIVATASEPIQMAEVNDPNSFDVKPDRNAYMREYMRKKREADRLKQSKKGKE